jgi:hypothetical protein
LRRAAKTIVLEKMPFAARVSASAAKGEPLVPNVASSSRGFALLSRAQASSARRHLREHVGDLPERVEDLPERVEDLSETSESSRSHRNLPDRIGPLGSRFELVTRGESMVGRLVAGSVLDPAGTAIPSISAYATNASRRRAWPRASAFTHGGRSTTKCSMPDPLSWLPNVCL